MAQLPEKIKPEIIEGGSVKVVRSLSVEAQKLNEIIDYLGELEGGKDAGN